MKNNVYLLTRVDKIGYDEYRAKVVIAKNADEARLLANVKVGDEGKIWFDRTKVQCQKVNDDYPSIVLACFNPG